MNFYNFITQQQTEVVEVDGKSEWQNQLEIGCKFNEL